MSILQSRIPGALIRVLMAAVLLCLPCVAQNDYHPFTFNVGGGVTPVVGELHSRLETGWHLTAGAGYNFNEAFSVGAEYMYTSLGVTSEEIARIGVPDADVFMHSVGLNSKITYNAESRARFYLIGGVGWYHRVFEATRPAVGFVNVFDPWWGFVGTVPVVTNVVVGEQSRDAFGGNAGAGVQVRMGDSGWNFYAESRYHHILTARRATQIVPVTAGIRW